jgi:hypothetical protein
MNILPIEFRVLGGVWCGDVVALNGSGHKTSTRMFGCIHLARYCCTAC